MSTLNEIAHRHGRDRWKDALFIGAALLLTALSIGSVTSKAAGTNDSKWTSSNVTVIESNLELVGP
ncbi:MAG: hypothetical protein JWP01_3784 [Myxococcales bacterium]|nr:hypothetical protein [Myxococcales bacterium]